MEMRRTIVAMVDQLVEAPTNRTTNKDSTDGFMLSKPVVLSIRGSFSLILVPSKWRCFIILRTSLRCSS